MAHERVSLVISADFPGDAYRQVEFQPQYVAIYKDGRMEAKSALPDFAKYGLRR
jgi:hypothetical protein